VGIVLQAKLDRTKGDLRDIIKNAEYAIPKSRIRVRACIGIYDEDEGRATRDKAVAKASLFERIKELFDTGAYVEFATHDQPLLRKILNEIIPPVDKSRFEFQFLKGVRSVEGVATDLIAKGFKVRYYMPIEMQPGDGDRYILRRLSESPDMAENFLKDSLKYGLQRIAKAARS
jgi:hypothetical protein